MLIHGKEYTEVKDRIREFRQKFPNWSIRTAPLFNSPNCDKIMIRAELRAPDDSQVFTGIAYEERVEKSSEVNFTSWVENCETSAIGRALANMDIGVAATGNRPSAEEMQKVERLKAGSGLSFPEKPEKTTEAASRSTPAHTSVRKVFGQRTTPSMDEAKEQVLTAGKALKALLGHDGAFLQALENRNVKSLDEIKTLKDLADLKESLVSFAETVAREIVDVAKTPGATMANLSGEDRTQAEDFVKKLSLLI